MVQQLETRWSLKVGPRFPPTPGSPGNFVAPVTCADGQNAVLKVSDYIWETSTEIEALRIWDGTGAARLLAADPELGALLIERVQPGTMLAELEDDDETVQVAAEVLRQLWRPPSEDNALRPLDSWLAAYDRNREAIHRGQDGFPKDLFTRADALRAELLASAAEPVVLHGDLHHFNVLRSDRAGWLAIDPKGLTGDRLFDLCQFLVNPKPVPASVNRRRLDIFCAELGLDRKRASNWCLVHAMLNACWAYEDAEAWQTRVEYAEQTLTY